MLQPLQVFPLRAAVQTGEFDLLGALADSLTNAGFALADGDILAVSSKYAAISEGRVVELAEVVPTPEAEAIAARYNMNPRLVQLIMQESDHIFGGIQLGFLLTHTHGIISPNAGLDRSNIPSGKVVLFPKAPYATAANIRRGLRDRFGVDAGVILTDSWLMPGRWGTTGVALACAGFQPLADERGKTDLFGNPMQVTQRGVADSLCVAAQCVMGERDEATPFAVLRNTGVEILEIDLSVSNVSIPWDMCIYVESLTIGALNPRLPDENYRA
jgi:coenzyme F420-0:L-glutamate ligase / coenzyme F420-1:gamma-L-glutamate ligase